jgi:hypothetical protein
VTVCGTGITAYLVPGFGLRNGYYDSIMRVLVACESSGTVRDAFRRLGHDAWSCDLLPADDADMRHFQADCIQVIRQQPWDLIIAHPPCTHLAVSGSRHFAKKRADGRQQQGIDLFMSVVKACDESGAKWAIENPIGIMSRLYRKPDQIIQPWWFGHPETKATCLWLHKLPLLTKTHDVYAHMMTLPIKERQRIYWMSGKDVWKKRSKTYQGVADAMAARWG